MDVSRPALATRFFPLPTVLGMVLHLVGSHSHERTLEALEHEHAHCLFQRLTFPGLEVTLGEAL